MTHIVLAIFTMFVASVIVTQAEAGLVEDLRRGNSEINAVSSGRASASGWALPNFKALLTKPGPRAMAMHGHAGFWLAWGYPSTASATEAAVSGCENEWGGTCKVYAVGSKIVEGFSQQELADAIEALDLSKNYGTASEPLYIYCRRNDGSVYVSSVGLKCGTHIKIFKAEYSRLKRGQKTTAVASEVEAESQSDIDTLDASLVRLKKLLDKGLITPDEAAVWRRELLDLPANAD